MAVKLSNHTTNNLVKITTGKWDATPIAMPIAMPIAKGYSGASSKPKTSLILSSIVA